MMFLSFIKGLKEIAASHVKGQKQGEWGQYQKKTPQKGVP